MSASSPASAAIAVHLRVGERGEEAATKQKQRSLSRIHDLQTSPNVVETGAEGSDIDIQRWRGRILSLSQVVEMEGWPSDAKRSWSAVAQTNERGQGRPGA